MKRNLQIKIDDDEEEKKFGQVSPQKTGRTTTTQALYLQGLRPPTTQAKKEPVIEIKTIIKQEKDNEMFITDAPDIDFDALNDQQTQGILEVIQSENQGQENSDDIIEDEVIASKAYQYFKKQELEIFEYAPEDNEYSSNILNNKYLEVPSLRIKRIQEELDLLEAELKQLEKEEMNIKYDEINDSQMQLNEIEYLKMQMHDIVESDAFKEIDEKSRFDDILQDNYEDRLQKALDSIITENISLLENKLANKVEMGNEIELNIGTSKQTELQKEQGKRYKQIEQQLDQYEKVIGEWNPQNKFMTVYSILDQLCDKVDMQDNKTFDMIGNKAKDLNKELETLVSRLGQLRDVDYNKNKIDYLYLMTEKALENDPHIQIIIDRLSALERIHKESPNISSSYQSVKELSPEVQQRLDKEAKLIDATKQQLVDSIKEIQEELKTFSEVKSSA